MRYARILLASLFTVLIIVGMARSASAQLPPPPDLVIDPHGIDVNVSSTFTINVWIKNIPSGYYMVAFDFAVFWDPTMMELISHDFHADDFGWTTVQDDVSVAGECYLAANKFDQIVYWDANYIWVILEFRCLTGGSSQISATQAQTVTLQLKGFPTQVTVPFDVDEITVNQHAPAPAPVGGFALPVNKLAVLAPYLALIGLVGAVTVAVAATRRRKV